MYNSNRPKLKIKEYGRYMQEITQLTTSIEDRERRLKLAHGVVDLMAQMNPHIKSQEDYKHKLWDHLHIIADHGLDVDSEFPAPDKEELAKRPKHIGYPRTQLRYKHYGKYVEGLIKRAVEETDETKRKAFAEIIGNYMKLVYKNWNRENVNDDIIREDLRNMSGGVLHLDEESNLDSLSRQFPQRRFTPNSGRQGGYQKKHGYKKFYPKGSQGRRR